MEQNRCELCNCVLEESKRVSANEERRFGEICKNCLNGLSEKDEYAEYSTIKRRERKLNNFSFWYPKVMNCGIKMPKSLIFKVPENIQERFLADDGNGEEEYKAVDEWVNQEILPVLKRENMYLLFVKNATFSNKFDATTCMTTPRNFANSIIDINYDALIFCAGGSDEVVVRERIMYNPVVTPCIYKGLPLRSEFRVFYDFSKKKVIFTENYWRYDYVFPNLHDITDKIIFEHEKTRLEEDFESKKQEVEKLVAEAMQNVVGLEGPWSVDIMCENGEYYLIDMALAEMSAYWINRPGYEAILTREKEVSERREETFRKKSIAIEILDSEKVLSIEEGLKTN